MALPVPADVRGDTLTDNQRATWAKQAGFPDNQIATAVAVSIAENRSGAIDAVGGPNPNGTYDYGMWQINEGAHLGLFERFPRWWSVENANMAKAVWDGAGGSWNPWTTFRTGAYKAYMARGEKAAKEAPAGGTGQTDPNEEWDIPGISDQIDALTAVAEVLRGIGNAVKTAAGSLWKTGQWAANPNNWERVALVVAGGGLLIVGTTLLLKPVVQPIAQQAAKLAGPASGGSAGKASAAASTSAKG
jgi:lysozyme-like protein